METIKQHPSFAFININRFFGGSNSFFGVDGPYFGDKYNITISRGEITDDPNHYHLKKTEEIISLRLTKEQLTSILININGEATPVTIERYLGEKVQESNTEENLIARQAIEKNINKKEFEVKENLEEIKKTLYELKFSKKRIEKKDLINLECKIRQLNNSLKQINSLKNKI